MTTSRSCPRGRKRETVCRSVPLKKTVLCTLEEASASASAGIRGVIGGIRRDTAGYVRQDTVGYRNAYKAVKYRVRLNGYRWERCSVG